MKRTNAWMYPAVAALLTTSVIGCSSGGTKTDGASGTTPPASTPAADANKKLTITGMRYVYGDVPGLDGRGLKMINEKFNVDYKPNLVPQGTYDEKLTATLASGSIPDITLFQSGDLTSKFNKFAKQGAFTPLDEYIDQYPSLKRIPKFVLDQFRVNGKLYAIPQYYPKFGFTTIVRKDWLDNLGLKVPTSYEELKQVAIAFTKNDPDKNGKNDTYGLAMGKDVNPPFTQGAYWDPGAWYHKDAQGRFIPGLIGPGRKDMIAMLADLYKEGAITRDFATIDWANTNKEFYSGIAGIFIGTPRGMSQAYMDGLMKINPQAKFVHLEQFRAPDGSQGMTAGGGFIGFQVISAEAGKDKAKVKRILDMMEAGRAFYPDDKKNDKNPDYDWLYGNVGTGYDMVDGKPVAKKEAAAQGLYPLAYLPDTIAWPEKDSDVNYLSAYQEPLKQLAADIMKSYSTMKYYANPSNGIVSETMIAKGAELNKFLYDEQTKMIAGQRPLSDWDKMIDEWKAKGGEQLIKEMNAEIKIKDAKEGWN
ncbi:extracellular solute-binding protein [Paenibacillus flagellatus]|uniref:extracellular solute-binding protein n=1 Tax=Paenibacillus flagellatus TaxID=2211139 RepID=UPI001FEB1650|nr:extracellular solute-binding protein [Paenibacillus flagellatus]